jgi:hypothetical protein
MWGNIHIQFYFFYYLIYESTFKYLDIIFTIFYYPMYGSTFYHNVLCLTQVKTSNITYLYVEVEDLGCTNL